MSLLEIGRLKSTRFSSPERRLWSDVDIATLLETVGAWNEVVVVVPVYNGGEVVRECFESLLRHTPVEVPIVAIDDASPNDGTRTMLDEMAQTTRVRLVRHTENRGYTRTANHGAVIAGEADFVLLNSDAIVGPGWLTGLRLVAYSGPEVGTVSAVSNDAGGVSVPVMGRSNSWFPSRPWSETTRIVKRQATTFSLESPAGHGFCFYVRRAAFDLVGNFDEESFPVGYGEEVDFSQRVLRAGLTNLIAPHVIVKHYRSQSFGKEKRHELVRASRHVLRARYPRLVDTVFDYETSPENIVMRRDLDRIRRTPLGAMRAGGPRVLSTGHGEASIVEHDPQRGPLTIWSGPVPDRSEEVVELALRHGCDTLRTSAKDLIELARLVGLVVENKKGQDMLNDFGDNEVVIEGTARVSGEIRGSGNVVRISSTAATCDITLRINGDNNHIELDDVGAIRGLTIRVGNHRAADRCRLSIGSGTSFEGGCQVLLYQDGVPLLLGSDCMVSNTVVFRAGEHPHLIFDKTSGDYLDLSDGIEVGDHVWVGEGAYITKNVTIPSGCIVAARGVVTRRFSEEDAVLGGNPAKVVRSGIEWVRNSSRLERGGRYEETYRSAKADRAGVSSDPDDYWAWSRDRDA